LDYSEFCYNGIKVGISSNKYIANMTKEEFEKPCACGSGKMAGQCCSSGASCYCGSSKPVGQCCMAPKKEGADA